MKIRYECEYCGQTIAELEEDNLERLGLHNLTDEQKGDIIKFNGKNNLIVKTVCDDCITGWDADDFSTDIRYKFPKSVIH